MPKKLDIEHTIIFGNMRGEAFYKTQEWRKARYQALKFYGNRCQLCGASPRNGHQLHVDHIKPRSLYPDRCLDFNNLQVLCETCHMAKGTKYIDDCRNKYTKISPSKLKDIFRITRKHLVLEMRCPKNRAEMKYLSSDARTSNKKYKQRWSWFIRFCFESKLSYPEASILTVSDMVNYKGARGKILQKFLVWGDERPDKTESDPAFDIAGCTFPAHIHDLLADDAITVKEVI